MKKNIFIFLLIFSLLIISGGEYKCKALDNSFLIMEKYLLEESCFTENGIKVEYTIKESLKDEFNRIQNLLSNKVDLEVTSEKNNIFAEGKNINYSVNMYNLSDLLKVEIIIINKNENITHKNLIILAEEIRSNKYIEERYFSFVKGKLKENDTEIVDDMINKINISSMELVEINNGYTINLTTQNKKRVNISKANYDTGSYLIIGTPIIFITY